MKRLELVWRLLVYHPLQSQNKKVRRPVAVWLRCCSYRLATDCSCCYNLSKQVPYMQAFATDN